LKLKQFTRDKTRKYMLFLTFENFKQKVIFCQKKSGGIWKFSVFEGGV